MRKVLFNDEDVDESPALPEKRQRKKWTAEETQNLVAGCNKVCAILALVQSMYLSFLIPSFLIKWGVGNWKAILKDPELKFDSRSPVDLKDRLVTSSHNLNVVIAQSLNIDKLE